MCKSWNYTETKNEGMLASFGFDTRFSVWRGSCLSIEIRSLGLKGKDVVCGILYAYRVSQDIYLDEHSKFLLFRVVIFNQFMLRIYYKTLLRWTKLVRRVGIRANSNTKVLCISYKSLKIYYGVVKGSQWNYQENVL